MVSNAQIPNRLIRHRLANCRLTNRRSHDTSSHDRAANPESVAKLMEQKTLYWTYEFQLLMAQRMGATIPTVRKWLKRTAELENAAYKFESKPRSN